MLKNTSRKKTKIFKKVLAVALGLLLITPASQPVFAADWTIKDGVLVKFRTDSTAVSVTVPEGVTAIANEAFSGDTSLEEIILPDTIRKIGDRAFYNCSSLKELEIPGGVESIGESAFSHCSSLNSASIPASVKSIGNGVFAGATSLKTISVNAKNPYFFANDGVLYNKASTKLIQYAAGKDDEVFDMPFSVEKVAPYAFWGADKLKAIYVSNSVSDIEPFSFANAKGLEGVFLPNSVTSIQQYAFRDDYNLRLVGAEEEKIDVHPSAFSGCASNLKPVKVSPDIDLIKTAEKIRLEKTADGESKVVGKVVMADREKTSSPDSDSGKAKKSASADSAGGKTDVSTGSTPDAAKAQSASDNSASDNKAGNEKNQSAATPPVAAAKPAAPPLPGKGYAYVPITGTGKVYQEGRTVGIGRINRDQVYIQPVHR